MFNIDGYLNKVLNRGYRSSAISSLLWLNALITVPCFLASFQIVTNFRWAPFSIGTLIILYTLRNYGILRKIDPRLLQSEKYQLEMQKLDIIAKKGGPIMFDNVNIPLSDDPKLLEQKDVVEKNKVSDDE